MPRASYANVTATIALVVALSAGAYAAGLGRNDVKSKNIAPKAVKTSDLAAKAVKTKKIGKDAVTGEKVAEATLGTVPDADALDGLDSAAFLKGAGKVRGVVGADDYGGEPSTPIPLDVGGEFSAECRNPASVGSDLIFRNTSAAPIDVWIEKTQTGFAPGTTQTHTAVGPGAAASIQVSGPVVDSGQSSVHFVIAAGDRVTLVEARMIAGSGACRFPLVIADLSG